MNPNQSARPFSRRAHDVGTPPLACYLMNLIAIKRSNLAVSADVHSTKALLQLAEDVGDHICILKTHADIIDDWSTETIVGLQAVAKRKKFLLFEDRKLGDIGNTLQSQYTRGPMRIATWAHLTNAHLLPGPAIVPVLHAAAQATLTTLNQSVDTTITGGDGNTSSAGGLGVQTTSIEALDPEQTSNKTLFTHHRTSSGMISATTTVSQHLEPTSPCSPPALIKSLSLESEQDTTEPYSPTSALAELGPPPHARGLLLLAEMSSEGNLLTKEYTEACVKAAHDNPDFVMGYIAQRNLNTGSDDNLITMAPGVNLPPAGQAATVTGDGKGQRYRTPQDVVGRDGVDVIIVGRGILGAEDRVKEAERYRKAAWEAYEGRIRGRR